jgi:predicted dinucleotide-binding enzyme
MNITCADDEGARSTVIALAKEIGFEGVDAGRLDASRNIKNLGLLVGQLAYGSGFGNPPYAARLCSVVCCSTLTCLAGRVA